MICIAAVFSLWYSKTQSRCKISAYSIPGQKFSIINSPKYSIFSRHPSKTEFHPNQKFKRKKLLSFLWTFIEMDKSVNFKIRDLLIYFFKIGNISILGRVRERKKRRKRINNYIIDIDVDVYLPFFVSNGFSDHLSNGSKQLYNTKYEQRFGKYHSRLFPIIYLYEKENGSVGRGGVENAKRSFTFFIWKSICIFMIYSLYMNNKQAIYHRAMRKIWETLFFNAHALFYFGGCIFIMGRQESAHTLTFHNRFNCLEQKVASGFRLLFKKSCLAAYLLVKNRILKQVFLIVFEKAFFQRVKSL